MNDHDRNAAVGDPDWIALSWYGQTLDWLCARHGLLRLDPEAPRTSAWLELPNAASGHLVAVTPSLVEAGAAAPDVVVGGPCINDCTSFPTLEALYDCVQVLQTARALGVPSVLYVGDREEALGSGGAGKWTKLGERMAAWIRGLAEVVGADSVHVVLTSSAAHEEALAAAGHPASSADEAALDAAFHLGSAAPRAQDEDARAVTRRVVEAHLPPVVARHAGSSAVPRVLVAENLQQSGCALLARFLAARAAGVVDLAAHLPAPGLSGAERMYRSGWWDKLPAWELPRVTSGASSSVHPLTRQFFGCWQDEGLREQLAARARAW